MTAVLQTWLLPGAVHEQLKSTLLEFLGLVTTDAMPYGPLIGYIKIGNVSFGKYDQFWGSKQQERTP